MYAKFGKYCKIHGVIEFLSPPKVYWISQNSTVGSRNTIIITLSAIGTQPITYQWYKGAVSILNATTSTLTITGLSTSDTGIYTCVLSNYKGSITSTGVQITVLDSLSVIQQTIALSANTGTTAVFSVTATGSEPITYQWYKDGVITNGSGSNYFVPNVNSNSQGYYLCVLSNEVSQVSTAAIPLSVI
jgi:hypothetical protein